MAKPKREPPAPEGAALQWHHLDPESQQAVKENWAEMGKVKTRHAEAVRAATAARDKPGAKAEYVAKQEGRLRALAAIEPHITDKPMTIAGATQARVQRVQQGRRRAEKEGPQIDKETGWTLPQVPRGTGWYFEHHAHIAAAAHQQGVDVNKAITATTALSPQNNPTTELKGGRAMIDMIANQKDHTIHITPELRAHTAKRISDLGGPEIPKEWEGTTKKISQLHSAHIAGISSKNAEMRNAGHPVQSTANFTDLGATRLSDEIKKGVEHLRGQRSEQETIDPHSSPKVWSYKEGTKNSVPGSRTHLEYLARAMEFQRGGPEEIAKGRQRPAGFREETPQEQVGRTRAGAESVRAGQEDWGSARHILASHQSTLSTLGRGKPSLPDIRPLRGSEEGVLSSKAHTAEDTWMQSISTRQTPKSVRGLEQGRGRAGTSVAKTAGSDPQLAAEKSMTKRSQKEGSAASVAPDPRIGGSALNHAINNYATHQAAAKLGTPAMFVQETGWTEQRIQAEKDPEYAREMLNRKQEQRSQRPTGPGRESLPKQAPPLSRQFPGSSPHPTAPIDHAAAKAAYDRAVGGMKPPS